MVSASNAAARKWKQKTAAQLQRLIAAAAHSPQIKAMTGNFPERQFVSAGDVRFAAYEADGDPARIRPPIILIHGWPEIAYSWKNQINEFAEAGFRTIAIDLKGFGYSDAPAETSLYDIEHITSDLAALLDALDIEKAYFCGHDWGGSIVWSMGQWRPERIAGIIGVCTPLRPRPPAPPITILKNRFTEKHYFVQFQEPEVPERLFETDVERFVQMMFRRPPPRSRWAALAPEIFDLPGRFKSDRPAHKNDLIVSDEVVQTYVDAFKHSGFHGGVNLYRNVDRNWELMEGRDEIVRAPSLWIGADLDLFLPPEAAEGMEKIVPNLEKHVINNSGHWLTWEQPKALNSLILDWLMRQISN